MTCFNPWVGTQFKHDEEPRAVTKVRKQRAKAKSLEDAYEAVNVRDKSLCWVTGRYVIAGAPAASMRREHHHLKGRRVMPEWVNRPERIITVCAEAHQLITLGWIVVEGTDARKQLFFHWRADVKPEQKTLVIQRKRVRPEAD